MFRSLLCHTTERRCIVELGYFNNIVEWTADGVVQLLAFFGDAAPKIFIGVVVTSAVTAALLLIARDKASRSEGVVILMLAIIVVAVIFGEWLRSLSGVIILLGGIVVMARSRAIVKYLGGVKRSKE